MAGLVSAVFYGRCGHQWLGHESGEYACPRCGDHDGDRHVEAIDPLDDILGLGRQMYVQPHEEGTDE